MSGRQPEQQAEHRPPDPIQLPPIDRRRVLREGVPRLLMNSLGPVAAFVAGNRLAGVVGGIVAASVVSLCLFGWEQRKGRPGLLASITFAMLCLEVTVGLVARSATLFFLPTIGMDLLQGAACFVSTFTRLPLAVVLAGELLSLPRSALRVPPIRRLFVRLTLVWASYFTVRGIVCLVVLLIFPTEVYLAVRVAIDAPIVIPLLAWSVGYGVTRIKELSS